MQYLDKFAATCKEFDLVRDELDQAVATIQDVRVKQLLGELTAELDTQYAALKEVVPNTVAELEKRRGETLQSVEATQAEIDDLKRKFEELQAAEESVPVPPPEHSYDPRQGQTLREELLKLVSGMPLDHAPVPSDAGAVQDLASAAWNVSQQTHAFAARKAPTNQGQPPGEPTRRKAPSGDGEEVWDMTSGSWKKL